jgi:hypothetical protein
LIVECVGLMRSARLRQRLAQPNLQVDFFSSTPFES